MAANSSTANCFGYGCLSIVGLFFLGGLIASGAWPIVLLIVAGSITALVLRKKNKSSFSQVPAQPMPGFNPATGLPNYQTQAQVAPRIPNFAAMGEVPKGEYVTSICVHSFTDEDLKGKSKVVCECGYEFSVQLLKDYAKLRRQVLEAQEKLEATWLELQSLKNAPTGAYDAVSGGYVPTTSVPKAPATQKAASTAPTRAVPQPAAAPTVTAPAAKPKPAAPVVKRTKTTLAPQQWLIFGASFVIAIAGGLFVIDRVNNNAPPWFYLTVTIPLALATAFAAFWGRKISVLLSNFMATFSTAMQLASFLVIATIFVAGTPVEFYWNTAPAWWWGTDLLIVSVIALFLSRARANFGWKVISLVGFVGAVQCFAFGPINDVFPIGEGQFGFFASINVAAAVLLAILSKTVRGYTFDNQNKADAEYEKDLAKREDLALQRFTMVAASALAVLGVGYTAFSFVTGGFKIEPATFTLFALIWIAAGAIQGKWVDGLTTDKNLQEKINRIEHIVGFTALALALNAWVHLITDPFITAVGSTVLAIVAVVLGAKVARVKAHPVAILVAHYSLIVSWFLWYLSAGVSIENTLPLGVALFGFSLSLVVKQVFKFENNNTYVATITHALALAVIIYNLRTTAAIDSASLGYSFLALGLILLMVVYSPLMALLAKRSEAKVPSDWNSVVFILSAVVAALVTVPADIRNGLSYMNPIGMLMVSALATGVISQSARFADIKQLLTRYSFAFQVVLGVVLLSVTRSVSDLGFLATVLLLLSLLNYVLSFLGQDKLRSYVAYGLGLVGVILLSNPLQGVVEPWAHLLVIYALTGAVNILQLLMAKRTEANLSPVFTFASLFAALFSSVATNWNVWQEAQQSVFGMWLLIAFSLIFVVLAELGRFKQSMLLRVNALVYLTFAFVIFGVPGDLNQNLEKLMIIGSVFSVVALRELMLTSKKDNQQLTNGWFALAHLGPVVTASLLNLYLVNNFGQDTLTAEFYGVPFILALALPSYLNRSLTKEARALTGLDIPVLVLIALEVFKAFSVAVGSESAIVRMLIVLGFAAVFSFWRLQAEKRTAWLVFGYLSSAGTALSLSNLLQLKLWPDLQAPELYSVPFAISLVVSSLFLAKHRELLPGQKNFARVDGPVLVLLLPSIASSVVSDPSQTRLLITLVIAAAFAYWRSTTAKQFVWVVAGYLFSGLAALTGANLIQQQLLGNVFYPELYTVLLSLSLVVGSVFWNRQQELDTGRLTLARIDIPVLLPVVVSIAYSFTQSLTESSTLLRLLVSLALFTGYTYFKLSKNKVLAWALASYAGLLGSALTLIQLVTLQGWISWNGPEIFSVVLAATAVLGNSQLKKVVEFKTSLISFGLPLAILLLPSIAQTWTVLDKRFEMLSVVEITRVVLILVISLVAVILGVRAGNLGATSVSGAALALVVIPISWVRAEDAQTVDTQISVRSLIIAGVLFVIFGLLRRAEKISDNSYIYLGIPVAVALGPSLFLTIQALGQPDIRQVDWWRFGIIVVVSLVLLIVGSLRNLGGMFFPGLVGVMVGVLPYAFKPIASQSWFLWVVLLVIAGIMVWIAVRLEQLRKLGKSSVSWVKSLK